MMKRTVWLAFLLLPACAYQQAMQQGDSALAAADYDRARRAYAFAYDTKSSDAARDAMQRAQAAAIDGQLDGAEAAVASRKHVDADRLLREVELLDPDNERLVKVRGEARAAMMEAVSATVEDESADMREAYEVVTLARRLYPDAAEPEYALATLRERTLAEAADQAAAGDYASARATIALVREMEPWQAARTDELDRDIAVRWADELVAEARRARRGQPGLASVLYARAFEVAERPEDLEASRASFEAAAAAGPVDTYVDSGGPGQAVVLKNATRAALEGVPGVAEGRSNRWDLLAKIYASEPRCRETRETEKLTKDYISGQREVPNPEYVTVKGEFDAATEVADAASDVVDGVVPAHEEAATEERRLELEVQAAKRALEDAQSVLAQTKGQYDRWSADVKAIEAELDGLAPDATAARADAKERLAMTREYATDWEDKLERDQEAEAKTKAALVSAEKDLAEAKALAAKLGAERQTAESKLSEARQNVSRLQARLKPLPKTVMEDVPDTLEYDKVTWTNTCTSKVTVYLGSGWEPKPESPFRFEVSRKTSDVAHIGHEKAGVVKDPKEYPVANADLIAQITKESEQKLADLMVGLVDGYFATTLEQAYASMDPNDATDVLTEIYAGAATRMDAAQRDKYVAHLTEHHGLASLETLAPDAPPPPMQAKAAPAAEEAAPAEESAEGEETAQGEESAKAEETTPVDAEPAEQPAEEPAAQPADQPWGDLNSG